MIYPTTEYGELDEYELRQELSNPRRFRCSDGFCGQDDCARCRPGQDTESE